MAEYTNLTSLAGLQVGDVIIYNTTKEIDLAGYKVKFEVIGNNSYGGYSCGTLVNHSTDKVTFSTSYSSHFYKVTDTVSSYLYKRFIVAGNSGATGYNGKGGGLTGGRSSSSGSGYGGTQTAGGRSGTYNNTFGGKAGSFGSGGSASGASAGGAGWYGGGSSSTMTGYGAGGSGYVLTETSSKPTGYMTDYDTLLLTDTTLTTGGAESAYQTYGAYNIGIITIIETPSSGSTISEIQYYKDGTFIPSNVNYYTNSEFKTCDVYYHNGTEFIKI